MLYKESAIAVMVALMLGAASILGGFSAIPALATHDADADLVASKEVSQEDNEWTIVDAIEFVAREQTSRTSGTIIVAIVQDGKVVDSEEISTYGIMSRDYEDFEADFDAVNVTGSFEVLIEFEGSGGILGDHIRVVEGTETAGDGDDDGDEGSGDDGAGSGGNNGDDDTGDEDSDEQEIDNVVASKMFTFSGDDDFVIDTVKFVAREQTSRTSGTIIVAIVQDGKVVDSEEISTYGIMSRDYEDFEADFDLKVTDDFQVVIMFEGSGGILANSIVVPGATETAEEPDVEDPDGGEQIPEGEARLTVNAIDQNNHPISGLWVAVLQGMSLVDSGGTEVTFTLEAGGDYIVEMMDYYDAENDISYEFNGWDDSVQDSRRVIDNMPVTEEFTAKYIVTTGAGGPPPSDDGEGDDDTTTSPPVGDGSGSVTVFAFRMPSEHWGPTFTSANAAMYFILYNSTGDIVYSGFFNENGHTITGLNEGETYWVSPTDCDECHGDPHDVVFDHWDDDSTERQRPVTSGDSVSAYYRYDPDP